MVPADLKINVKKGTKCVSFYLWKESGFLKCENPGCLSMDLRGNNKDKMPSKKEEIVETIGL